MCNIEAASTPASKLQLHPLPATLYANECEDLFFAHVTKHCDLGFGPTSAAQILDMSIKSS